MLNEQQIKDRRFAYGSLTVLKAFLQDKFNELQKEVKSLTDPLPKLLNNIFKTKLVEPVKLDAPQIDKSFAEIIKEIENVNRTLLELSKREPVKVENKEIDFKSIIDKLSLLETAIKKIPEVSESNVGTAKIVSALKDLNRQVASIPKPEKIEIPKPEPVVFPNSFSMLEADSILSALKNLQDDIRALPKNMPKGSEPDLTVLLDSLNGVKTAITNIPTPQPIEFPESVMVSNFPIQKIAQPVTHISINSLSGYVKTTVATVTTSLTPLPTYGVLNNRRAIIIYNNSANIIYIGGSDVTTANGMPVPANSYSPILDAGIHMIIYGIAAVGSNNVRVMEASDEASGR